MAYKEKGPPRMAQRAKFREETPVTRQEEETILFLTVMMDPVLAGRPMEFCVLSVKFGLSRRGLP
jgi:hypothetical protein